MKCIQFEPLDNYTQPEVWRKEKFRLQMIYLFFMWKMQPLVNWSCKFGIFRYLSSLLIVRFRHISFLFVFTSSVYDISFWYLLFVWINGEKFGIHLYFVTFRSNRSLKFGLFRDFPWVRYTSLVSVTECADQAHLVVRQFSLENSHIWSVMSQNA
jgi:hypothetical protein